jgi:hypothetical protein
VYCHSTHSDHTFAAVAIQLFRRKCLLSKVFEYWSKNMEIQDFLVGHLVDRKNGGRIRLAASASTVSFVSTQMN